jgi:putative membrane protein
MSLFAQILIALVALIHVYIVYLEMVLWDTPRGHKAFAMTPQQAQNSKVLAANQGLYNGFLAAGLVWALVHPAAAFGAQIATFFLVCVAVAGVYGAMTAAKKIIYIQTLPATLALAALWFNP